MPRRTLRESGNVLGIDDALWDSAFLRACRGASTPRTPVWLMRQAGRYMAEYRAVREGRSFLELCQPELAAPVTTTAQRRIDADAAIIFADILLILRGLGMDLRFVAGDGPQLAPPLRDAGAIDALGDPLAAADACAFVAESCRRCRAELPADVPLIGFAGAPFTLSAYAIEGGGSRQWPQTRALMYRQSAAWHRLQERLVAALVPYLNRQIAAGAQAVQLFDSWAGALTRIDFDEFVLPHLQQLVAGIDDGAALIYFATGSNHLLESIAQLNCDVVGLDSTTALDEAWQRLGGPERVSVQGNLDPALLLAPRERLLAGADRVLAAADGRPGHIFNLGHGVLKETDVEAVIALIAHVHGRMG